MMYYTNLKHIYVIHSSIHSSYKSNGAHCVLINNVPYTAEQLARYHILILQTSKTSLLNSLS